jgi:hypothetical protein
LAGKANTTPTPHLFTDLFIPRGFKSNVLELMILRDLQAYFSELRILKGIGEAFERLNVTRLNVKSEDKERLGRSEPRRRERLARGMEGRD